MKIAIFSDCFLDLTGGITSSIRAQKRALEERGHEVEVFSTGFPRSKAELSKLAQDKIYQVPSCKLFFWKLTPVSRRPGIIEKWLLREHPEIREYDVFYVHYEAGCSIAGLRLGKRLGIPTVQVMHGREDMGETNIIPYGLRTFVAWGLNWLHSWYMPHKARVRRDQYLADNTAKAYMWTLMVNHANYADLVITPSRHFRDKLVHYGVTKKIEVVPNGYPDDLFPTEVKVRELRDGKKLRMIWHSRVSAEKRMMPFLRALTQVRGKWRMDVYGGGGDYFRAQRFARRNGLNVKFHGNVKFEVIKKALAKSHLDILASYNFDTFGMTLIEAEAAGVPVFFCDPDMREVVPIGGYLMSDFIDPQSMAATLNLIMDDPAKIRKMSTVMIKHRHEILESERIKGLEKIFVQLVRSFAKDEQSDKIKS